MVKDLVYYLSLQYTVVITPVENAFEASIPELGKQLLGKGTTLDEALKNLDVCKKIVFKDELDDGHEIPEPKDLSKSRIIFIPEKVMYKWNLKHPAKKFMGALIAFLKADTVDEGRLQKLEEIISNQKHQLSFLNKSLADKNKQLDAMHYVWCDGGCKTGAHRYKDMKGIPLTEDIILVAERNVQRLRRWFEGKKHRELIDKAKEDKC